MKRDMSMYRVYGMDDLGNVYDEYCEAFTAQKAVDKARGWHSFGGEIQNGYEVIEVSMVLRGWK